MIDIMDNVLVGVHFEGLYFSTIFQPLLRLIESSGIVSTNSQLKNASYCYKRLLTHCLQKFPKTITNQPYLSNTMAVLICASIIEADFIDAIKELLTFFDKPISSKAIKQNYKTLFDGSIKSV